jgi:intraflagellar transport protein 140
LHSQDADAATRSALVEFSFQLARGRLEEAFRAVAGVSSAAVWRNMAHMAIKSKRLDVAGGRFFPPARAHAWRV